MKRGNKGFTLMEMLIVVAIIAILVTIAIPSFTKLLEKSREAADIANVRSAYAEVMYAAYLDDDESFAKTVPLEQKIDDWQMEGEINIGGITQANKDNWIGNPKGSGTCAVYYDAAKGVILNWRGSLIHSYGWSVWEPLDIAKKHNSNLANSPNYEIDRFSEGQITNSIFNLAQNELKASLLSKPNCSWGYYGNAKDNKNTLIWSSVDISDEKMAGKTVPVIIMTQDGGFRVTDVTVYRKTNGDKTYNVLADNKNGNYQYSNYLQTGTAYKTQEEAYKAYEEKVSQGEYRDTLN